VLVSVLASAAVFLNATYTIFIYIGGLYSEETVSQAHARDVLRNLNKRKTMRRMKVRTERLEIHYSRFENALKEMI
jgi:hypothetical protein